MKRRAIALILALSMALALTACGMEPADYIARGDEYIAVQDYESAIAYYEKAGEAGIEKMKQTHLTVAKKRLWADDFEKAIEYLNTEAASLVTPEEIGELFVAHIVEQLEEEKERRIPIIEEAEEELRKHYTGEIDLHYTDVNDLRETWTENLGWYSEKIVTLLEDSAPYIPEGTPGWLELCNEGYYLTGCLELRSDRFDFYQYTHWDYILSYWERCTEGPGFEICQAVELVKAKKYQEAFQSMKEWIEDPAVLKSLYTEVASEVKVETVADALNMRKGYRCVFPGANDSKTLEEASYTSAKIRQDTDIELTKVMVQEIYDNCAKNPDGKVLILNRQDYADKTIGIYTHGMDQLPDSCYPETLESVEYVIYMDTNTVETGNKFGSSTKELRRDAIITIYNAKTGKSLWTQTQQGPTDFIMTYYGDTPPTVYCAGDPAVNLADGFAEIAKYLK